MTDLNQLNSGGGEFKAVFINSYSKLDQISPGKWVMSTGEKSISFPGEMVDDKRGLLTTLYQAIPIPEKDVPLEDVLAFREKRLSEVLQLRAAIDEFYQSWVNSQDQDHSYAVAKDHIEAACCDAIRVAKESGLPFKLSSWKIGYSVSVTEILAGVGAMAITSELGLPSLIVGAAAASSFISIKQDIGLKSPTKDLSPFNIVSSIHREFG
jgi:hypothetical protein